MTVPKPWITALKWALTLGAAVLIARKVDFRALWPVLAQCKIGYLFLALAAQYFIGALVAWRWKLVYHIPGLPLHKYLYFVFLGYFFNAFVPSSAASDALRVLAFGRKYGSLQANIGVNLVIRALGLCVQAGVAVASLWLYRRDLAKLQSLGGLTFDWRLVGAAGLIGAAGLAVAWGYRGALLRQPWIAEMVRVLKDRPLVGKAFLLSIVIQGVYIFSLWCMFMSLYPGVRIWQIAVFPTLIQAILVLPISFGGVGVREYLNLFFFSDIAGIPHESTLAVSILGYVPILALAVTGGLWMSFRRARSGEG